MTWQQGKHGRTAASEEELALRRANRTLNRTMRMAGLPVPIAHRAYTVTITAAAMPDWARRMSLKGFPQPTASVVTLKSKRHALMLSNIDRAKKGAGKIDRVEFRVCKSCGQIVKGTAAVELREWERHHPGQLPICGPDCVVNGKPVGGVA